MAKGKTQSYLLKNSFAYKALSPSNNKIYEKKKTFTTVNQKKGKKKTWFP
jgi:hypothetical protein